jgi:hypothetical protein
VSRTRPHGLLVDEVMRALLVCLAAVATLAGCSLAERGDSPVRASGSERFVPPRYRQNGHVVMPLTFPDGTTAELLYPPRFRLGRFTIRPYGSGRLPRQHPMPPWIGNTVGRDFFIVNRGARVVLARMRRGRAPKIIAEYEMPGGQRVGLWDVGADVNYLAFQFGRWAVLVYDYKSAGAMTDDERALWVESFSGREADRGWLVVEGDEPLRLARAGEHAGPELMFHMPGRERGFSLYPGKCRPHRDQTRVVGGKQVQWSRGFADWCLSESMRIHASGTRSFVGALISALEVRGVGLKR